MNRDFKSWYNKIKDNNPENYSESCCRTSCDWREQFYTNNPIGDGEPRNNPSQYDFEINFFHFYNKKRDILFKSEGGRLRKSATMERGRIGKITRKFSVFFNWEK